MKMIVYTRPVPASEMPSGEMLFGLISSALEPFSVIAVEVSQVAHVNDGSDAYEACS